MLENTETQWSWTDAQKLAGALNSDLEDQASRTRSRGGHFDHIWTLMEDGLGTVAEPYSMRISVAPEYFVSHRLGRGRYQPLSASLDPHRTISAYVEVEGLDTLD